MTIKSNELYRMLHNEIGVIMAQKGLKKATPSLSYHQHHTKGVFKVQFTCARMAVNVINEGSYFEVFMGLCDTKNERIDGNRKSVRLTDVMTYEERLLIQNLNAAVCDKRLEFWKKWAESKPEPIRNLYQTWEPPWSRISNPPEKMAENLNHNRVEYLDESDVANIGNLLRSILADKIDAAKAEFE
jgi:hypothetical protein